MAVESIEQGAASREFWRGARASIAVVVASAPFGLLFGALAVQNGFSVGEAVLMSATVYGGASQMVGVELFGQKVAPWMIVLSIFVVNSRHLLYSAVFGRRISHWPVFQKAIAFFFLVDPQFAESERKAEAGEPITFVWYMGMAIPICVFWILDTLVGAMFGSLLSNAHAIGIDFLLPIYFLGMVMDFRERPYWLPIVLVSAVASIIAVKTVGSPWHVSIGAAAGILLAVILNPGTQGQKA
jgi:4-azaleucine resistance transporter AzlC